MPHLPTLSSTDDDSDVVFPPVTQDHIQNCSYDSWFPKYRSSCIKSRIIPLSPPFVSYLLEDGIVLADDEGDSDAVDDEEWHTNSSTSVARAPRDDKMSFSDEEKDEEEDEEEAAAAQIPPNKRFPETHGLIKETIAQLGGAVVPKLNWSSPKDAKWISRHQNTLKCTSPSDIYLLLKSSSFVSHDLVHAFDDCAPAPPSRPLAPVLVLRPYFNPHAALEFRCFVRHRSLIGISQRDLNYYPFLSGLRRQITAKIESFFRTTLRHTFPDDSFTFDVYIPEVSSEDDGLGRVRLMDINPWAPRTDSLLFTWQELLNTEVTSPLYGFAPPEAGTSASGDESLTDETDDETRTEDGLPGVKTELRLVEKDDPAAYNFSTPQYSAHKLPKEVVDASLSGEGGLREFALQWREITEGRGGDLWSQSGT